MKKNLLIIDDDLGYVSVVQKYLTKQGFSILIANNEEKINEYLNLSSPEVILIDVLMNNKKGLKILKKISKSYNIKLLVISKAKDINTIEQAFKNGAYDYIIKPFNIRDLVNKIICAISNTKQVHHV